MQDLLDQIITDDEDIYWNSQKSQLLKSHNAVIEDLFSKFIIWVIRIVDVSFGVHN